MKLDSIFGKLIAITRGIYLMAPASYSRIDVFTPPRCRQVQWWFSNSAISETRQLAEMISAITCRLRNCECSCDSLGDRSSLERKLS